MSLGTLTVLLTPLCDYCFNNAYLIHYLCTYPRQGQCVLISDQRPLPAFVDQMMWLEIGTSMYLFFRIYGPC